MERTINNILGQKFKPYFVIYDEKNEYWLVSDKQNHQIHIFSWSDYPSGIKYKKSWGSYGKNPFQFNNPNGMTLQPFTNHLLVCDKINNRVQVLDDNGKYLYMIPMDSKFSEPEGICCKNNGEIFVSDVANNNIKLLDGKGSFIRKFGHSGEYDFQFSNPGCLSMIDRCFSPSSVASSLLVVSDYYNERICLWNADGSQPITIHKLGYSPYGICVDMDGMIYVGNPSRGIEMYDPRKFQKLPTGIHKRVFLYPVGICVNHNYNTLMVADLSSIQLFDVILRLK